MTIEKIKTEGGGGVRSVCGAETAAAAPDSRGSSLPPFTPAPGEASRETVATYQDIKHPFLLRMIISRQRYVVQKVHRL